MQRSKNKFNKRELISPFSTLKKTLQTSNKKNQTLPFWWEKRFIQCKISCQICKELKSLLLIFIHANLESFPLFTLNKLQEGHKLNFMLCEQQRFHKMYAFSRLLRIGAKVWRELQQMPAAIGRSAAIQTFQDGPFGRVVEEDSIDPKCFCPNREHFARKISIFFEAGGAAAPLPPSPVPYAYVIQ